MAQGTQDIPNSFGVNEFFQFFGQALTHDVAEAATGRSGDPPIFVTGLPFPINRTPFEDGTSGTGPRQQVNEETSFLDLSMVYGNNKTLTDLARADLPGHAGQSAKLLLGAGDVLPTIKQVATDSGLTSLEVLAGSRDVAAPECIFSHAFVSDFIFWIDLQRAPVVLVRLGETLLQR